MLFTYKKNKDIWDIDISMVSLTFFISSLSQRKTSNELSQNERFHQWCLDFDSCYNQILRNIDFIHKALKRTSSSCKAQMLLFMLKTEILRTPYVSTSFVNPQATIQSFTKQEWLFTPIKMGQIFKKRRIKKKHINSVP